MPAAPLFDARQAPVHKIKVASRSTLGFELELQARDLGSGRGSLPAGRREPGPRGVLSRSEHAGHGVQENDRWQVDPLEISGRGEHAVDESRLHATLPRREEIEPEPVGRVHARHAVAAETPALVGVFPLEDDVGRVLDVRCLLDPSGDIFCIRDRGIEPGPSAAGRRAEGEDQRPKHGTGRRTGSHSAAPLGVALTRAASCRLTASGSRRGRP